MLENSMQQVAKIIPKRSEHGNQNPLKIKNWAKQTSKKFILGSLKNGRQNSPPRGGGVNVIPLENNR